MPPPTKMIRWLHGKARRAAFAGMISGCSSWYSVPFQVSAQRPAASTFWSQSTSVPYGSGMMKP